MSINVLLLLLLFTTIFSPSKSLQFLQELYNFTQNLNTNITTNNNIPTISPSPLPSPPPPPQFPQELYNFSQNLNTNNTTNNNTPTISPPPPPPEVSTPLAPAFFIIGDSSVDCGTNNYLGTFARADRLPYGRDFDTHRPTGRFCNGRIPVDYLGN